MHFRWNGQKSSIVARRFWNWPIVPHLPVSQIFMRILKWNFMQSFHKLILSYFQSFGNSDWWSLARRHKAPRFQGHIPALGGLWITIQDEGLFGPSRNRIASRHAPLWSNEAHLNSRHSQPCILQGLRHFDRSSRQLSRRTSTLISQSCKCLYSYLPLISSC